MFNLKSVEKSKSRVDKLVDYIKTVGNPFDVHSPAQLINLTSRVVVANTEYLLNCVEFGRANYDKSKS